jgi:transcriptional regulator with XRE-family HTH domain
VKNNMRFGEMLRRLRKERDLTQAALAEQIGVTHVYISALERGDKPAPRLEIVVGLARSLGVEEGELWTIARSEREERLEARIQGQPTSLRNPKSNKTIGKPGFAAISLEIRKLARRLEKAVISKQEEQALLEELEGLKQTLSGLGDSQ